MLGLYLDPTTHDLALEGGTLAKIPSREQAIRQQIKTRLLMSRGEYFLDVRQGLPYYREILRKAPNIPRIRSIFRQAIESVPGVVDVPVLSVTLDPRSRKLSVRFEARALGDLVVSSEDFGPLLIEV